jgi:hypothetical protein
MRVWRVAAKLVVAIAAKNSRMAWDVLRQGERFTVLA